MLPYTDNVRTQSSPDVIYVLICICTLVFFYEISLSDPIPSLCQNWRLNNFIYDLGVVPWRLFQHRDILQVLTLFTSLFIHAGWGHIIGNMWFLYLFGRSVEDRMGHGKFLLFYLMCGLSANICYICFALFHKGDTLPCVGASGAIFGIMGAYLIFNVDARIRLWIPFTTIEVPAMLIMLYYYAYNCLMAALSKVLESHTGLIYLVIDAALTEAFAAHIGGFLTGITLANCFDTRHRQHQAR